MADRPVVAVTHWIHPEVRERIAAFAELRAPRDRTVWSRAETIARAADADALIACMADRVDDELLAACPRLRIVSATLKGYDNFDAAACERRGVWLTIVPTSIIGPTAELAVALALGLLRRIREADAAVRCAPYAGWRPTLYGATLEDAEVGILGMGALGRAIARRLGGFGAVLSYADERPLDPGREAELAVRRRGVGDVLAESDVVLVALPLTAATRGLVGAELLGAMRPSAALVNVGRGSVVDEAAVARSLAAGRLAGYAADVHATEDWALPDRPAGIDPGLLEHPRTLLTPHVGSAVDDVRRAMSTTAADQVRAVLEGRAPEHAVAGPTGRAPQGSRPGATTPPPPRRAPRSAGSS